MGGAKAAYAPPARGSSSHKDDESRRGGGAQDSVHSVRRSQPTHYVNNQAYDSADERGSSIKVNGKVGRQGVSDASSTLPRGNSRGINNEDNVDGEYEDEDDDDILEQRERELMQEREEMRAQFMFKDESRRSLKEQWMNSMRRKRRMLMRNENLRFRELYKPPEPGVLISVIAVVTIVSLILTKSWPFY